MNFWFLSPLLQSSFSLFLYLTYLFWGKFTSRSFFAYLFLFLFHRLYFFIPLRLVNLFCERLFRKRMCMINSSIKLLEIIFRDRLLLINLLIWYRWYISRLLHNMCFLSIFHFLLNLIFHFHQLLIQHLTPFQFLSDKIVKNWNIDIKFIQFRCNFWLLFDIIDKIFDNFIIELCYFFWIHFVLLYFLYIF